MPGVNKMTYIRPKHCAFEDTAASITADTRINCENDLIKAMFRKVERKAEDVGQAFRMVDFKPCYTKDIIEKVENAFSIPFTNNEEGYIIDIRENVVIYARSERGLFYASSLLAQYLEEHKNRLRHGIIYDYPECPVRGVKIYLPHKDDIDFFKRFIDMISYYKYNTVMIEVGGAMEYKRHPEINEAWRKYCSEMSEYSGKTKKIQEQTYKWRKNSIHVENGGGSYLGQEIVRELVEYCKARFIEVIPEMPSLSHCDYMVIAHDELKERKEDPYPDTYCPSNGESYRLLFDLLDEVIEVFGPKSLNMGHDEYYSIALCDRCRGKSGHDIFAEDISRIHHYLSGHKVKMMIWGDKLLNALDDAGNHGGAEIEARDYVTNEYFCTIPATYKAIDRIPGDIEILHWYWGRDESLEKEFLNRGFPTVYGNFEGMIFPHWKERVSRGIKGAILSNWSRLREEYLQRNEFTFNLAFSAKMLWEEYNDSMYPIVRDRAFEELYRYKCSQMLERLSQRVETEGKNPYADYLEISHTTDYYTGYRRFEDGVFIEKDKYHLGEYIVEYEDGQKECIPIVHGWNISYKYVSWDRGYHAKTEHYEVDGLLFETAMTALPKKQDGITWYDFLWINPHPGKAINAVKLNPDSSKGCNIMIREIRFKTGGER